MEASAECPESASAAGEETGLEETDTRSEETESGGARSGTGLEAVLYSLSCCR